MPSSPRPDLQPMSDRVKAKKPVASRDPSDFGEPPARVRCPFCGGRDTELVATFGSLLMTSQYHCRPCRSTFEHVRNERD